MPVLDTYGEFLLGYPLIELSNIQMPWRLYMSRVPLTDWKDWEHYAKYKNQITTGGCIMGYSTHLMNEAALAERIDIIETQGKRIAICFVNDHLQKVRKEVVEKLQENIK